MLCPVTCDEGGLGPVYSTASGTAHCSGIVVLTVAPSSDTHTHTHTHTHCIRRRPASVSDSLAMYSSTV